MIRSTLETSGGRIALNNILLQWNYIKNRDVNLYQSAAYITGMCDMASSLGKRDLYDELILLRRMLIMWQAEDMNTAGGAI
jgi:hypothetical protein